MRSARTESKILGGIALWAAWKPGWVPGGAAVSHDRPFRYRNDVLTALEGHGVRPTSHTPPEVVRGYVRDLYKYEIRALRERYMRREFPKREYADRVEQLRRRYSVLALLPRQLIE